MLTGKGDMVNSAPAEPYESDWVQCGDRHYKVLCVPSRLPLFVPQYLNGDLFAAILAGLIYAWSDRPPYAVRVVWVKRLWWKWVWHRHISEDFASMSEGKARAREYTAGLREGCVPETA